MPFCPCQYTGGVLVTIAIFSPCEDTSQMGPTFSVISMRPSGRKAIRQGNSKVATVVMLKGRLASGFCSPTLVWGNAATEATVKSNAVLANFIIMIILWFQSARFQRSRASMSIVHYHGDGAK